MTTCSASSPVLEKLSVILPLICLPSFHLPRVKKSTPGLAHWPSVECIFIFTCSIVQLVVPPPLQFGAGLLKACPIPQPERTPPTLSPPPPLSFSVFLGINMPYFNESFDAKFSLQIFDHDANSPIGKCSGPRRESPRFLLKRGGGRGAGLPTI
jgi:hypothetical protein